jgi:hypothetical protein
MIKIQKLVRPYRTSGYALPPGETTEVRGLTVTNTNGFTVYVDKFTRRKPRRAK